MKQKTQAASWAGRITPTSDCQSCSRLCQNLRACLADGPMTPREQQIVNLTVARHWNARYPWFAQVRRSLSVGIEQAVIDAINTRKTPNLTDARERTCFAVSSELLANKRVSD